MQKCGKNIERDSERRAQTTEQAWDQEHNNTRREQAYGEKDRNIGSAGKRARQRIPNSTENNEGTRKKVERIQPGKRGRGVMSKRWNAAQQDVLQPETQRRCESGVESQRDEANAQRGVKKERDPELQTGQERKSAEAKRNMLTVARIVREAGKREHERGIIKCAPTKDV